MAGTNDEQKAQEEEEKKLVHKQPCEVAVWYIVPCIRGCLAREMVRMDITQQEVGDLLGISQAGVSQYVREKRGRSYTRHEEVYSRVEKLARDLVEGRVDDLPSRICEICRVIQRKPEFLQSCGVPVDEDERLNICD